MSLPGSGSGGATPRIRYVGDISTHQKDSGRISPRGDTPTDGAAANTSGGWELTYPPQGKNMIYVNLEEVKTYVSNLQITVTQFIAYRPIVDMFLVA